MVAVIIIALLTLFLMLMLIGIVIIFKKYKKLLGVSNSLKEVEEKLSSAYDDLESSSDLYETSLSNLAELNEAIGVEQDKKNKLKVDIQIAESNKEAAIKLAEKELELEREKHLSDYNKYLIAEKEKMLLNSDLTKYTQGLKEINDEIELARHTLEIQQKQEFNAVEKENFVNTHSIVLTSRDEEDIELVREFAEKLSRKEIFFKLIWTEFYQKPMQLLCKTLSAEKITGIYKITNIKNNRVYIGQSVDIASRWKEHCKAGLGIGSTVYLTNKFYKALRETGIENFTFEILDICSRETLDSRESFWIEFYNAVTFGYNSKNGG